MEIHHKHHKTLLLYALGLCKKFQLDPSYAYDLMQDFYIAAMGNFEMLEKKYRENGLGALCRTLRYDIYDLGRKKKSIKRVEQVFSESRLKSNSIYYLCSEIQSELFYRVMEQCLSERDFNLMCLYIEGYSYDEIAEKLKMKNGTVSSAIHRSKEKLEVHFKRPDNDSDKPQELFPKE